MSDPSVPLDLLCAYIPEIPTDVTTAIEGNDLSVSWVLPSANGSPITVFKVFLKEIGTETYTLESTECDGTDADIIANNKCYITLTTMLAPPYNVDGGDSIWAKVSASNYYGESAQSDAGNDAIYLRVPDKPINLAEDIT